MTKFDLHIHSCYSHNLYGTRILCPPSRSTPEGIIKAAIKKGIDVIAVTDHDNILGSLRTIEVARSKKYRNKILVIPGVEVSTKDGHILAYNVYEDIPKNLSAPQTIAIIKKRGGFAVAAHPFNLKYSLKMKQIRVNQNNLFGLEIANAHSFKNDFTQKYIRKHNLKYTVGSDAHTLKEIGLCYGITSKKIRSVKAMIEALENKEIRSVHRHKRIISNIVFNTLPGAVFSFFYWKSRQLFSVFNKKVFLPYKDSV